MLFYLGLWGLVNGWSRKEPLRITQMAKMNLPQITQIGADSERRD
jgi:hypothetical protein